MQVGLLRPPSGQQIPLKLAAAAGSRLLSASNASTALLLLNGARATFKFTGVPEEPVLSVLRDFSAPVMARVEGQTPEDLAVVAASDPDTFARWVGRLGQCQPRASGSSKLSTTSPLSACHL
jgi:aminopeptidase N